MNKNNVRNRYAHLSNDWLPSLDSSVNYFTSVLEELEKKTTKSDRSKVYDEQIQFSIPGLTKEDIDISVEDNKLIVSSKRASHFCPLFTETFVLTKNADTENITAECKDGVLTVFTPLKQKEEQTIKKVLIK